MAFMELEPAMEQKVFNNWAGEPPSRSIKTEKEDVINQDILNIEHTSKDECMTRSHGLFNKDFIKRENDGVIKKEFNNVNTPGLYGDIKVKCENYVDIKCEYNDVINQDLCKTEEATIDVQQHDGAFAREDYSSADGLPLATASQKHAGVQEENKTMEDKLQMKLDTRGNQNDDDGPLVNNKISTAIVPYQIDCEFESSNQLKVRDSTACYMCNVCNYVTDLKSKLIKHLKDHPGVTQFICQICNKAFCQHSLEMHMRTLNEEKLFSCDLCDKSFKDSSNLKVHMRSHSGDKPFTCKLCNKSFAQKGNLTVHVKTHSRERLFSCYVCNKAFKQKGSLKRHLSKHS